MKETINAKQDVRHKLIQAGARAMRSKSYHAVGIQEILAAVAVPKGSFYYYFPSKEAFGVAIIEYYGAYLSQWMARSLTKEDLTPRERLRDYFERLREYYGSQGLERGCLVVQLATEVGNASPVMRQALQVQVNNWTKQLSECLAAGQVAGEIVLQHDPDHLAAFIHDAWEGVLIRMQVEQSLVALDFFLDYLFTLVLPVLNENSFPGRERSGN